MNGNSRVSKVLKNSIVGLGAQVVAVLLSFITRTVFIATLSVDYLGINALFTSILTMLSLAELGFGGAVIYSLYKPLAENDERKIGGLINFYSTIYKRIGITIGVLGLLIAPFLNVFIEGNPNVGNIYIIYVLFLLNTVSSYFFVYKKSILNADQKNYISSIIHLAVTILKTALQLYVLYISNNYYVYLVIQVLSTLIENLIISKIVDRQYSFINANQHELDQKEKDNIWENVKALMIYKIGSTTLDSSDNIVISAFVNVSSVGLLSNYNLIVGTVSMGIEQVTSAVTSSVGNFVSTESNNRQESLLYKLSFVYSMTFGFASILLIMLLNPFIELWIGVQYVFSLPVVFIIVLNWHITGIMNPIWTFRSTKGLFKHGKYRPIFSSLINIVVSLILVQYLDVLGVLYGTLVTRITTNWWYDSYIVFKHGFNKSAKKYLLKQIKYSISFLIPLFLLQILFKFLPELNASIFILQIILVFTVTIITLLVIYSKSEELVFFKAIVFKGFNHIRKK